MFYGMFFLSYGASFSKVLYLQRQPTYSPTNQLTNFQVIAKDALHAIGMQVFAWRNICEKALKAVDFTSVQIIFNIIVGIGAA